MKVPHEQQQPAKYSECAQLWENCVVTLAHPRLGMLLSGRVHNPEQIDGKRVTEALLH